jgi:hypothetical protein
MVKKIIILIAILTLMILIPIIAIDMYRSHLNTKFEKMAFSYYYSKKNIIVQLQNYIEKQLKNNPKIATVSIIRDYDINNHDYVFIRIHSNDSAFVEVFRFELSVALKKRMNKNINMKDDFDKDIDSLFQNKRLDLYEVLDVLNLMNNNDILSIANDRNFCQIDVFGDVVSIMRIPKGKKFHNSTAPPSVFKQIEGEYYYFYCSYCD